MVLPVVIGVGVVALGLISYPAMKKWWNGKHIAVLGGRGVGKTTFLHYLQTQKIDPDFQPSATGSEEGYHSMTIKIDDIELHIKSGHDVSGSKTNYNDWRKQIKHSDIVIYILDISRVVGKHKDEDYINDTKEDIYAIQNEIQTRQKKLTIFLIISHTDKLDDYNSNFKQYETKINKNQLVNTAIIAFGGMDNCKIIIGSLKDTESAKKLTKDILNRYNK